MKEHYKTERELVELIGRSYKERNIELIKPYLHSNIIYASAWVDEILRGANKFLNYMIEKFKTQAASDWKMDFIIHPLRYNKYHFLVLKQNNDRQKTAIVHIEFKHNRIYYMRLCPTKPVPFTFIEPSWYFERAKQEHLKTKMFEFAMKLDIKNVVHCINKGVKVDSHHTRNLEGETILTVISKVSKWESTPFMLKRWHYEKVARNEEELQKINDMKQKLIAAGYFKDISSFEKFRENRDNYEMGEKLLDAYIRRLIKYPVAKRIEMLKVLIEKRARINDLNESEIKQARTALFYAVKQREPEMVELLLQNGANPNLKFPGLKESLLDLTINDLKIEEEAGEDFVLRDGKDIEMQREEIVNLKLIINLLKQYNHDKSN